MQLRMQLESVGDIASQSIDVLWLLSRFDLTMPGLHGCHRHRQARHYRAHPRFQSADAWVLLQGHADVTVAAWGCMHSVP